MDKSETRVVRPALGLAELPIHVLRSIFSNLSFHHIALLRPVCKAFDVECRAMLNEGVDKFLTYTANRMAIERAKIPTDLEMLPRWHDLRHDYDEIWAANSTVKEMCDKYGNYLLEGKCCFIAGKILDEAWIYLKLVDQKAPSRAIGNQMYNVGTDLCWMAEEHFEEVVLALYLNPKPPQPPFCDRCREKEVKSKKGNLSSFWKKKAREIRLKKRVEKMQILRLRTQLKCEREKYLDNEYALAYYVGSLRPEYQWKVIVDE